MVANRLYFLYWGIITTSYALSIFFFFFQAEDGIRDYKVTGVQTCALPIWAHAPVDSMRMSRVGSTTNSSLSIQSSAARTSDSRASWVSITTFTGSLVDRKSVV